MPKIDDLIQKAKEANYQYRIGTPIMLDSEYDALIEEIELMDPNHSFLKQVGFSEFDIDERKERLPILMASMNKTKNLDDLMKWAKLKKIPFDERVVLMPKYDGMSLVVHEPSKTAWTRGDGIFGQRSDKHFSIITSNNKKISTEIIKKMKTNFQSEYSFGEVIMKRSIFMEKYAQSEYKNPRNLVAGLINSKEINEEILKDCDFIRFGLNDKEDGSTVSKTRQIEFCNELNMSFGYRMPFKIKTIESLNEEELIDLYKAWRLEYEIDGIIVELDNPKLRIDLGRETGSNNPVFARAFKSPMFEEKKISVVNGITWQVSKQGFLKPVVHIQPTELDGVTVSNVTGNNAKNIEKLKIGKGAEIEIKRSGQVIPLITNILKASTETNLLPSLCPSCSHAVEKNENGVELVCNNPNCKEQQLQRMVAFFSILNIASVGEGVCQKLYEHGFNSIEKALTATKKELATINGLGEKSATKILENMHASLENIPIEALQHASGLFKGLGSRKLALLSDISIAVLESGNLEEIKIEEIKKRGGFAEKSAQEFLIGMKLFIEFYKKLPEWIDVIYQKEVERQDNTLINQTFVFTGFRDADMETEIKKRGGSIGSSVNKKTTFLVVKDKQTSSSKAEKAKELGVTIIDRNDLTDLMEEPESICFSDVGMTLKNIQGKGVGL